MGWLASAGSLARIVFPLLAGVLSQVTPLILFLDIYPRTPHLVFFSKPLSSVCIYSIDYEPFN